MVSKHWAWAVCPYIGLEKFYSAYNVRLGSDTTLGMVDEEHFLNMLPQNWYMQINSFDFYMYI